MQCPQCAVELDATARHQCPQCRGMFVSDAQLNEMLSTMDKKQDVASPGSAGARSEANAERRSIDRRTTADWPTGEQKSQRKCPVCATEMFRMTVERVILERCPDHGIWFDQDELPRVLSPNVDEHTYAADHEARQMAADGFELGSLGVVIRAVYGQIRRPKP